MHEQFQIILFLLAIAAGITAFAKKLNKPYPIALVIAGTIIGISPIQGLDSLKQLASEDEFFRFAIISIFLPTLLGEATLKLPFSQLKENRVAILTLAFGCTFLTFIAIGFMSHFFLGLSFTVAFVFASLMSATDPVSVLSIFKSMGVNKTLSIIIEGESLFNDGIAVVLFTLSAFYLEDYLHMGAMGFVYGGITFFQVVLGGIFIGGVMGYLFSQLTKFFDDYPLEIIFSMILFYGSFFIAEHFHVSGVIAVVTSGLIFGNYGVKTGMSPATKMNIDNFWDVLALLANSMVFLMVGLVIARLDLVDQWGFMVLAVVVAIIGRSFGVYISLLFLKKIPYRWKHTLNWGGLKGSLSIALALSLPSDFPGREHIIVLTFSVVVFSLIVQGLTIKPFVAFLGVKYAHEGILEYEEAVSQLHRYNAATERLESLKKDILISNIVYRKIKRDYEKKIEETLLFLEQLYEQNPALKKQEMQLAQKQALYAEYQAVELMERNNLISDTISGEERKKIINRMEENNE